jgi:hypothetical protein
MKKQLSSITLTLAATLVIGSTFAQSDLAFNHASANASGDRSPANDYSKNIKVDRAFTKRFTDAKRVSWRATGEEYIATFKTGDRLAVAWYTKSGTMYCVNYYGTENHLPEAEHELINEHYPEFHVTATVEIEKNNNTTYVVTIQSCTMQKKVKIVNGETEEMETLKLAK